MGTVRFEPENEMQVREWFAAHIGEYEYDLVGSVGAYPDYVLEKDGTRYRVEVELNSSNFIVHRHDPQGCDFVLCWCHDSVLPLPVWELKGNRWYQANEAGEVSMPSPEKQAWRKEQAYKRNGKWEAAIEKSRAEYEQFLACFVADLEVYGAYQQAATGPRTELIRASRVLQKALQKHGVRDIDGLHPYDLFHAIQKHVKA